MWRKSYWIVGLCAFQSSDCRVTVCINTVLTMRINNANLCIYLLLHEDKISCGNLTTSLVENLFPVPEIRFSDMDQSGLF